MIYSGPSLNADEEPATSYPGNRSSADGGPSAPVQNVNPSDPQEKQKLFWQLTFEDKKDLFCKLDFDEKQLLYNKLSTDEKQKLFEQLGSQEQQNISGVKPPSQWVSNALWLIVVLSFASVLLGAFISIAFGVFRALAPQETQLLLTLFTSAVGFLGGLLVPSPMRSNQAQ